MSAARRHGSFPFLPMPRDPAVAATMTMKEREAEGEAAMISEHFSSNSSSSLYVVLSISSRCKGAEIQIIYHSRLFSLGEIQIFFTAGVSLSGCGVFSQVSILIFSNAPPLPRPRQTMLVSHRSKLASAIRATTNGALVPTVASAAPITTTARRASHGDACCCAVVYVSEGRNSALLDSLAAAASATLANVGLIRQFRDPTYHRTGFTIGGKCPRSVAKASLELSRRALLAIDLRMHEASHPRIGVVDHVSVHPLGKGGQQLAHEAGVAIGKALSEEEGLPVLLYGDLNDGKGLAEVSNGMRLNDMCLLRT